MDLLGVGPLELLLLFVIILLIFGPEDLVQTGRKIGRFFSQVVKSESWRATQSALRELRQLPNRLAREAELEALEEEDRGKTISPPGQTTPSDPTEDQQTIEKGIKAWTTPPEPDRDSAPDRQTREEQDEETANRQQPAK